LLTNRGYTEVSQKTGLEEISDLLEADFWPGTTSGLPVIRPQAAENLQIGLSMFGL
jgi:hypothetical protein